MPVLINAVVLAVLLTTQATSDANNVTPLVVHNYFVPVQPYQRKCIYSHFDNGYGYKWRDCVQVDQQ